MCTLCELYSVDDLGTAWVHTDLLETGAATGSPGTVGGGSGIGGPGGAEGIGAGAGYVTVGVTGPSAEGPGAPRAAAAAVGAEAAPLPNGTIFELADYLKQGYWDFAGTFYRSFNMGSTGAAAKNGVIHYNYTGFSGISGAGTDTDGLSAARRALVDDVFDYLGSILNIDFVQTASTSTGVVDIYFKDNASGAFENANLAGSGNGTSNHRYTNYAWVNVNSTWSGGTSDVNDYTYQTFIHEIFHALGLGHQGAYNGSATYITDSTQATSNNNVFLNDSWQQSIMSYFDQTENTTVDADQNFVITGMAADWEALDDYYGISAYAGNTVYGFNTNIGAATSQTMADLALYADETAFCIIDSGGVDTLDFSGYAADQRINLAVASGSSTVGSVSDIGGQVGNMTIAVGTVIENAVGGSGDDDIVGNDFDNTLTGNGGDDLIKGLGGADVLYGGSGIDTMTGNDGDDVLYGGTLGDDLQGGNDDDVLDGGSAVDTVDGGDGNDTIVASTGNFYDFVDGGTGTDTLDHGDSAYGGNTFDFEAGTITGGGAPGGTTVTGIEIYLDGSGGNTIVSSGTSGTYYGGDGDDTLVSEIGGETMYGGTGVDTIDHTRFDGAYVYNMVTGATNFGGERYTGFEVVLMGDGNDVVTTTAAGETVFGGLGNDALVAGDSSFGNGDVYDGGAGLGDTLDFSAFGWGTPPSEVRFDLGNDEASYNGAVEAILGIENFLGSTGDEKVFGANGEDNTLAGNAGNDVINGRTGNDDIDGGAGNDSLIGGGGADSITDGDGLDRVSGAKGADVFDFGIDGFDDVITDYNDSADLIRLVGQTFGTLTFTQVNGKTVEIDYGTDTLVVKNKTALLVSDFAANDFLFV